MQENDERQSTMAKENLEQLKWYHDHFSRINAISTFRMERCKDLMGRRSAKRWSSKKVERMQRRLMTATKDVEQSSNVLDQVSFRFSQNVSSV